MEKANSPPVIAAILAFMFEQNKKEHPIPAGRAKILAQKIRDLIYRKEENKNG